MDDKLQIIAGILAVFFLGVAIAKSAARRARRKEAAAKSIANSRSGATVALHDPFAGQPHQNPAAAGTNAAVPETRAQAAQPPPQAHPAPDAQSGQTYKWI